MTKNQNLSEDIKIALKNQTLGQARNSFIATLSLYTNLKQSGQQFGMSPWFQFHDQLARRWGETSGQEVSPAAFEQHLIETLDRIGTRKALEDLIESVRDFAKRPNH